MCELADLPQKPIFLKEYIYLDIIKSETLNLISKNLDVFPEIKCIKQTNRALNKMTLCFPTLTVKEHGQDFSDLFVIAHRGNIRALAAMRTRGNYSVMGRVIVNIILYLASCPINRAHLFL